MKVMEVETFILKFKQLWKAGLSAHLDLDTQAGSGEAWVGIRVRQVPGPHHLDVQHPCRTTDCPSLQRCQARKTAAKQRENEQAIEENEIAGIVVEPPKAEEATTNKVVNDAMEKDAKTAEISEESSNCKNENVKLMERLLLLVFNVELNISSRII